MNKAEALVLSAEKTFPDTTWAARPVEIADCGTASLAAVDLIFSCVDSDLARLEIAYLSTAFCVPVSDGGLGGSSYSHGRVSWFPGGGGGCFCCKLPGQRRRELLTLWQATPFSCSIPPPVPFLPSTPTLSAIIGSMQVELGLRNFLAGLGQSESVEVTLDGKPRMDVFANAKAMDCPFHESKVEVRVLASESATAEDVLSGALFSELSEPYIRFDWPICAAARCIRCGAGWAPLVRVGWFRRRALCPACGSPEILMTETLKTLRSGDPWAACPLQRFGISSEHLVSVRPG